MNDALDIVAGHLTAGSLATAHRAVAPLLPVATIVLLTTVDSDDRVESLASLHRQLRERAVEFRSVGPALGFTLPTFDIALELLYGFDEAWYFERPPQRPRPMGCSLTSDAAVDDALVESLTPWMIETSALLGLGDGVGLNYAFPRTSPAAAAF